MNRSRSCALIFIPVLVAAALGLAIFIFAQINLSRQIITAYGTPDPQLGPLSRISLMLRLLQYNEDLSLPANPQGEPQNFQIALGESPLSIAERLQNQGMIRSAQAFNVFLMYSGLDTQIQAGGYTLSPANTAVEIAHALRDPNPGDATLVILAGWRLEEIGAALPTSGLSVAPEAFISAARAAAFEGMLFPGTYQLPRDTGIDDLLHVLTQAFEQTVTEEMRDGYAQQGLNLQQAITLASIIEREAVVADEMPLIASVFLNRLAIGMNLDADPTVQYAVGFNSAQNTWWTNPLSLADLQFDSPYNTYRYPGLPPGPIANPGINALRAVAFPAQTPYYYFRATCDGSGRHFFAETFDEHVNNACP
ncbi:MAG: endolytic transglycosylase MltG [Anaerolineae bacterium]|nr:endolytic transglycosylase MltG [Anaerolineae bacterium]